MDENAVRPLGRRAEELGQGTLDQGDSPGRRNPQAHRPDDEGKTYAELEGVSVDVRDGDARKIPFADATFDVVVSSLALHNIYSAKEREHALGEIARVLKPGGHAAIFDVRHGYARFFERNGFTIVKKWTTMLFGRSVVARKN